MKVETVEAVTKTKFKVQLEGYPAFILYKGELQKFAVREGEEIPEEVFERIRKEVLLKRAKLKALQLLSDMDRTKAGLEEKLRMAMYPEEIINETIAYVQSYSYLNDARYAENFVLSRKSQKSRREICALLLAKGIGPEEAETALEKYYDSDAQQDTILRLIRKKGIDPEKASGQELQKLYGYLSRKGFRYEDIRQAIQNHNKNA